VASLNPPVKVERITYKGWPDAVRLRNASCELVVVPAVSRVMHFSLIGGPNLLWENPEFAGKTFPTDEGKWHNIGGDKLWPTQQSLFLKYTGHNDWPPPWPWDGGASRAEMLPGGVRIALPHDARFGAHAVREFTLDHDKPLLHVRQWIEKTDGSPTDLTVWTVTQVNNPLVTLIPSENGEYSNLGPASEMIGVHKNYLTLAREQAKGLKIGVTPQGQNGWVASVFEVPAGRQMLILSHKLVEGGGYPSAVPASRGWPCVASASCIGMTSSPNQSSHASRGSHRRTEGRLDVSTCGSV